MKITIDLPEPLLREAKARAAHQGLDFHDLMVSYVAQGARTETPLSAQLGRSPLPIFRNAAEPVIPSLTNAQVADILDEEDSSKRFP